MSLWDDIRTSRWGTRKLFGHGRKLVDVIDNAHLIDPEGQMTDFTIKSPLFHLTQVAVDLDEARSVLQRIFYPCSVVDGGEWLGRSCVFVRVGDILMESMVTGAAVKPVREFLNRFGPHFHSVAWYVSGIDDLVDHLRLRGIKAWGLDGVEATGPRVIPHGPYPLTVDPEQPEFPAGWESATVLTSRRCAGIQEFCEPTTPHPQPRPPDAKQRRE